MKNSSICTALIFTVCALLSRPIVAHEFWLEPRSNQYSITDKIQVDVKNGQNFKSNNIAYLPYYFELFNITNAQSTHAVKSRIGDVPAVNQFVKREGLHIISYISHLNSLSYDEPGKFKKFIEYEGLLWVLPIHKKRGLADTGFKEVYRRFSKTLIQVGHGKGADKNTGMLFEWVAITNPFTTKKAITMQLLYQNEPFTNAPVNVFYKADKNAEASRINLTTDDKGYMIVPRKSAGLLLINSVHYLQPSPDQARSSHAAWYGLWASMMFHLK